VEAEICKSVTEIIDDVKTEICDSYCKYVDGVTKEEDSDEEYGKMIKEVCNSCPLNRRLGMKTEAAEVCPWCGVENTYPDYDVEMNGYKAFCKTCGHEIMLCDECLHADDNPGKKCDFKAKYYYSGNRITCVGICYRGITHNIRLD
jgi:hypothetical protein